MLTQNTRVAVDQFWQLRRLLARFTLRSALPTGVRPLVILSRQPYVQRGLDPLPPLVKRVGLPKWLSYDHEGGRLLDNNKQGGSLPK